MSEILDNIYMMSVLLSNASFLQLGYFRNTLCQLYSKLFFGDCVNSSFLMQKLNKTLYLFIYFVQKRAELNITPRWKPFVIFYRFEYRTSSHFNDLLLARTAYLKYFNSFMEFYRSTWVNKKLIFTDKL